METAPLFLKRAGPSPGHEGIRHMAATFTIEPVDPGVKRPHRPGPDGEWRRHRQRSPGEDTDAQSAGGQAGGRGPPGLRPPKQSSNAPPRPRGRIPPCAGSWEAKECGRTPRTPWPLPCWSRSGAATPGDGIGRVSGRTASCGIRLQLILLPVVIGTIPLWLRNRDYISRIRRVTYAVVIVASDRVRDRRRPASA